MEGDLGPLSLDPSRGSTWAPAPGNPVRTVIFFVKLNLEFRNQKPAALLP